MIACREKPLEAISGPSTSKKRRFAIEEHDRAAGQILDQQPVALFALTQLLFDEGAFRHVARDADVQVRVATRHPCEGQVDVHPRAVRVQMSRPVRKLRLRLQPSNDRAELKAGSAGERGHRSTDDLRAFPTQLAAGSSVGIDHDALAIDEEDPVLDELQRGPEPRLARSSENARDRVGQVCHALILGSRLSG